MTVSGRCRQTVPFTVRTGVPTMAMTRWLVAVSVVGVALGIVTSPALAAPGKKLEAYGYVVLAPGSSDGSSGPLQALARVVIAAPSEPCPKLSPGHRPMTPRTNPNPTTFAVTVCEAVYPIGESLHVDGLGITLPKVSSKQPEKIIVIGDTGCLDNSNQDCKTEWPFPAFAKDAASLHPDLVIHLGDYNYRGTPRTVNGQSVYNGCAMTSYVSQNPANDPGSTSWDRWEAWRDDFFRPAAPLLEEAPWVFTRGNHELCSQAGPGYFFFLDPHSALLGQDAALYQCPAQVNGSAPFPNLTFVAPYALTFDKGLTLLVMDSANACDTPAPVTNALAIYTAQFAGLPDLIQGQYAWLVSHRPIWGVRVNQPSMDCAASAGTCLNAVLQETLQASLGELPSAVTLPLAGHMHLFEAVNFDTVGRPPQLVIGNGGVALAGTSVTDFTADNLDDQNAHGVQLNDFGFFEIHLHHDGQWKGRLLDGKHRGDVLADCGSKEFSKSGSVCKLTGK